VGGCNQRRRPPGYRSQLGNQRWHYHWHANGFGRRDHRCEGGGLCLEHGPPEHHNHITSPPGDGNISLNNNCGSISPCRLTRLRSPTVVLYPDCADDSGGNYTFTGIPDGPTRSPVDHGPNSLFYPATYSNVVLSASTVTGRTSASRWATRFPAR